MIKNLLGIYKQVAGSLEYKNVFKNFSFLSALQVGSYIIPLITLPYLVSVLGAEFFGLIMFAQAFVQYFIIVTDYGFNFSATRDIALSKGDNLKISEIFCAVMILKLALFILSLLALIIITFSFERFAAFQIVYITTFATVIGNVLLPTWFFQGLEKMKYITMVSLSAKLISAALIFLLVHEPEHFLRVPIINAISSIVPSLLALVYAGKIFSLAFILPTADTLISQLRNGWFIFLASISSSMYSISNTFLLGIMFTNAYAGYYSFAEKIIRAGTSLFVPLNNALYPFMNIKMKDSPVQAIRIFKKILGVLILITGAGSLMVFFASDLIAFVNPDFYPSIEILKILSPILVVVAVSNLIGFQILYTNNLEGKFLISVFIAGLLNLFFTFLLADAYLYKAAAFSLLITEVFICCSFVFFSKNILFAKQ